MSLIVQKFGGSSVANADRVRNVAEIVTDAYRAGNQVVVVVSAQGDTTDDLIEKAREINPKASNREMDVLLSSGEQISMALLAMAIEKLGYPVVSLTGWQVPIRSTNQYSNARIRDVGTERLEMELDKSRIVIVAGFQGINQWDDITTLGRGGSDTTAVALAAALHADLCQIYTDVDGVYDADPRIVKNATKLDEITYDEMLELATLGAQVLHNRSVELAKKFHINLEVLSSFHRVPGTKIKEDTKLEKLMITGLAKDKDVARIALTEIEDAPGQAFKVFSVLAKEKINVDLILQSIGRNNTKDISFTVSKANLVRAMEALEKNKSYVGYQSIETDENIVKVSVVGAGMASNPGVAAKVFEALYNANINIHMISTSEIKISVLIDAEDADRAMNVIHDYFGLAH